MALEGGGIAPEGGNRLEGVIALEGGGGGGGVGIALEGGIAQRGE